ncbi:MAG: hypothetical protein E2O68_00450 [Deltaproteobacteria bacterium]|nr:MAG: hypothetical protein E2O68_00450 [Deltaproteobacteria bacterium]
MLYFGIKRSTFTIGPLRNPFLVLGTLAAQLLHLWSMHNPFMEKILGVSPVSPRKYGECLLYRP